MFVMQLEHAGATHNKVVLPHTTRSANAEQFSVALQVLDTPLNGAAQFVVAVQLKIEELNVSERSTFSSILLVCGSDR